MVRSDGISRFNFDTVAASYDAWYQQPIGQLYDALEKQAVDNVLPVPGLGHRLLDLGCGTGHWSRFFAERGYLVTGVDASREMIRIAREKGIPNTEFHSMDGVELPFPDRSFAVAAAITVLEFATQPERMLEELVRCVQPGGWILVGMLNRCSLLAMQRRLQRKSLYQAARLVSQKELQRMLSTYGEARVQAVAFVLPWHWAIWAAPILDVLGTTLRLPWGDFLVGRVRV